MRVLTILLLALACAAAPRPALAQTDCPPETPGGRDIVHRFATTDERTPATEVVPVMASSQVRLLADATDRAVCQRLRQIVASYRAGPTASTIGWALTFYRAGAYYIAVAVPTTPQVVQTSGQTRIRLRRSPLYVFDANLALVGGIAR